MKKKRTKWLLKHIYSNGYIKSGIIYNNPVKCDVIAFEYTFTDNKTKKVCCSSKELSIDEALVWIGTLTRAVSNYTENNSKIYLKRSHIKIKKTKK